MTIREAIEKLKVCGEIIGFDQELKLYDDYRNANWPCESLDVTKEGGVWFVAALPSN